MSKSKIHNVRFFNPHPNTIRTMALHNTFKKLAVCRSDASIEIWNLTSAPFLECTISTTTSNSSIEAISWCSDQLFSVGLHGFLVHYNLKKLAIENRWAVTGGACYCLDVNKSNDMLAIGTEQGYLNIFAVKDDGIYFEKFFDKQEGMIICLKFDSTGKFVASGSTDTVRVWNVETGHALHKMTTGRSEANKQTIVWSIEMTSDFTIITGDSRGKITFWDGKVGSQIESYQSHKADILGLCLSEDEKTLYAAGVDPTIVTYEKINVRGENQKWVKSIQRKIHEHDVNALVLYDNKLYSGGADSYLACSFHPPKTLLKYPPIPQSCVHLAREARYIMLRHPDHIDLWSLGQGQEVEQNYTGLIDLQDEPKKLLVLQKTVKDEDNVKEREGITCCCISNDGNWIMYSTNLDSRLFKLNKDENSLTLDKIELSCGPCIQGVFTPNNSQLITCPNSGGLNVYELADSKAELKQTIEIEEIKDTITFLQISSCGKYILIGDTSSNIVLWTSTSKRKIWTSHCKLPKYKFPATAMAMHPKTLNLVVSYSDSKIIEYDVIKRQYTSFSEKLSGLDFKSKFYPIKTITFDPRVKSIIILHDDNNLHIVNKEKKIVMKKKKAKIEQKEASPKAVNGIDVTATKVEVHTLKKYKHLVHFEWLSEDEMIAVEVNPLTLFEKLPPAFAQATFGKK
ncbi:unnamed protein product [Acanthoscelides obtectus]|uniref:Anaphase-promoting complex subunit 4-like WD40 domain-containing protein n=1 Tax=Acanthoscelides obtectus TaxID=200917 RepID=A0A9P0K1B2_ACAOB|nr:unnamed protein product [Acanthoscelides obtectus]CAK1660358.1 U3 small nucleolar RNA-associated protein 4 homolog [Acanthoscelides obtectus]